MTPFRVALLGLATILVMGGIWAVTKPPALADRLRDCGVEGVAGADIGGAFALTRHDGTRVDESVLAGAPSLVYFGFTYCPDICPTTLSTMSEAMDLLDERGIEAGGYLVSVDPARDTPDVLADYVSHFHPRIAGLTGSEADIAGAARAWRVYYARAEDEDLPDGYTMDHSGFLYLHDREGQFVTFFRHDAAPREVADIAACYFG